MGLACCFSSIDDNYNPLDTDRHRLHRRCCPMASWRVCAASFWTWPALVQSVIIKPGHETACSYISRITTSLFLALEVWEKTDSYTDTVHCMIIWMRETHSRRVGFVQVSCWRNGFVPVRVDLLILDYWRRLQWRHAAFRSLVLHL